MQNMSKEYSYNNMMCKSTRKFLNTTTVIGILYVMLEVTHTMRLAPFLFSRHGFCYHLWTGNTGGGFLDIVPKQEG